MVPIGNVDLVMAALRARLQRLARDKRTIHSSGTAAALRNTDQSKASEIHNLRQLSASEFDRTLVGWLLERELGDCLGTDPRFKQLIEQTSAILGLDPEIQALFRQIQQQDR